MSWLNCETQVNARKKIFTKLQCSICEKFKDPIATRRNFSDRWIVGAESIQTSNICDHASADQHVHAMLLLKKERAKADNCLSTSYAPIAQALSKLSELEMKQLRVKFDLAYFIAREKLAFSKYPKLC